MVRITCEQQCRYWRRLELEEPQLLGPLQIPQDHGATVVARERTAIVDGDGGGGAVVELDGAYGCAGACVPHPERPVEASRHDPASFIARGKAPHRAAMAGKAGHGLQQVRGLA